MISRSLCTWARSTSASGGSSAHNRYSSSPRVLRVADLEYDPVSLEARRGGRSLGLNPTSRKLLEFLMRETARIVPREELEFLLWGDERPDADVLRAHVHKLRETIDRDFDRKLLHTYRGTGYRLAALE